MQKNNNLREIIFKLKNDIKNIVNDNMNICTSLYNNICPCTFYCCNHDCFIYEICLNCSCYKQLKDKRKLYDKNICNNKCLINKNKESIISKENIFKSEGNNNNNEYPNTK